MTAMGLAVGIYIVSWMLLTASLVLQHIADKDGFAAIAWAFIPTIMILSGSYLSTVGSFVSQDAMLILISGGLLILTGVNFSKSVRRLRGEYS